MMGFLDKIKAWIHEFIEEKKEEDRIYKQMLKEEKQKFLSEKAYIKVDSMRKKAKEKARKGSILDQIKEHQKQKKKDGFSFLSDNSQPKKIL